MPLELEAWGLLGEWPASLGIALALTAVALRSRRGVALAAGSAGLAAVSTLLALGARAGELDAFPIGSTADFCLGLAAVWLTLAVAAGWRLRPGAPRAAAAVLGACCLLAVLGLGYFAAHKPGYVKDYRDHVKIMTDQYGYEGLRFPANFDGPRRGNVIVITSAGYLQREQLPSDHEGVRFIDTVDEILWHERQYTESAFSAPNIADAVLQTLQSTEVCS